MAQAFAAPAQQSFDAEAAKGHATQDVSDFDADEALAYSQSAIGRQTRNFSFRDSDSQPVEMAQFRGKPLVVSLIYTSCYHTCPVMTDRLSNAAATGWQALGRDSFNVVSIGFDSRNDTPQRMHQFRKNHKIKQDNWWFLSADQQTIDSLSDNLGFIFFRSAKGFDHLAQTTIITEEGDIYRQIYGADFEAPRLIEPLKDLVLGKRAQAPGLEGIVNRVRLFCTIYDPKSERYHFDYSLFVGLIAGLMSLGAIAFVLVRATWRHLRR